MIVQIDSEELNKLKRECAEAKDELRKIEETIYYNPNWGSPELQDRISRVEDALGFKLYCWQKTYIANGKFRRYGETTAKILKELLDIDGEPIDYRRPVRSKAEEFYRYELRDTKEKLDVAGIKTRDVIFSGTRDRRLNIKSEKSVKNCNSSYFVKSFDQALLNNKCNECPCFVASTNKICSDETVVATIITCEHNTMCNHLEDYLKKNANIKTSFTIDGKELAEAVVKYSTAELGSEAADDYMRSLFKGGNAGERKY